MDEVTYLVEMATGCLDTAKGIMAAKGHLVPSIAAGRIGSLKSIPLLPPHLIAQYNDRHFRTMVYEALTEYLTASLAEVAVTVSEAWGCEVAPEHTRHMSEAEKLRLFSHGTDWLTEWGFGRRFEMIQCVAQSRTRLVTASVRFERRDGSITFGETETSIQRQDQVPEGVNLKLFRSSGERTTGGLSEPPAK